MNKFLVVGAFMVFSSALSGCASSGSYANFENSNNLDAYRGSQINQYSGLGQNLMVNLDLSECLNREPSIQALAHKNVTSFSSSGALLKASNGGTELRYSVTYTQDGNERNLPLPFEAETNAFWDGNSFVITPKTSENASHVCYDGVVVANYLNSYL